MNQCQRQSRRALKHKTLKRIYSMFYMSRLANFIKQDTACACCLVVSDRSLIYEIHMTLHMIHSYALIAQ